MSSEELFRELAESRVREMGGFIVSMKILPNKKIVLEMDTPSGVNIADCAQLSYALNNDPDLESFFESHELEVSSPGMENPFRVHEQYLKNVGRKVKVKIKEEGEISGKLLNVTDEGIELEVSSDKKKEETQNRSIPFTSIIETKKVISFS